MEFSFFMKVILIKQVTALGNVGDIKDVSVGYARNHLIPRNIARPATQEALAAIQHKQEARAGRKEKQAKQFDALVKKLDGLRIEIKGKADETKTLFAGVNRERIVKELLQRGYAVSAAAVQLDAPIKKLGFYEVSIGFGDVSAKVGITVMRE